MSLGDSRIPEKKAEQAAEETLRLEIGNLPHLGDPSLENGRYVFPLLISLPRVIFDAESDEPIGVRFLSEAEIGEIEVSSATGEVVDRTSLSDIREGIAKKEQEVENAIRRALIKTSAAKFSRLPYSFHRYNPTVEFISELILNESIEKSRFRQMGDDGQKYEDRVEKLKETNLIREENNQYVAGDYLTGILSGEVTTSESEEDQSRPSEQLNLAMEHYFEQRADDLEELDEILGPHLRIAGFYYKRAITSNSLPKLSQDEIRRNFSQRYTGKEAKKKEFQTSRVLLQLEQVGLIQSTSEHGNRKWIGIKNIREGILQQREQIQPISEIAPA